MVLSGFVRSCFPRGNDANDRIGFAVAMADDEQISFLAEAEDNKPLFFLGVLGIVDNQRFLIVEYGLGFFKSNVVLFFVDGVLVFVPFKSDRFHNYIIIISPLCVKTVFTG